MRKLSLLTLAVACAMAVFYSTSVYAVTIYIGDKDGFGFGAAEGYKNANRGPCDINDNGILDMGDGLPDLNNNQIVATGQGDDFDNRSTAEKNATDGSKYTDVALSNSFSSVWGTKKYVAHNVQFIFTFDVPQEDDSDYGCDHFINLVYGDYDVTPMYAVVEGVQVELQGNQYGGIDGFIWRAYHVVQWADMLDGEVVIRIYAPDEPYVVFDYALLDMEPLAISAIPEPATLILIGLGIAGLIGKVKKQS
ncbi:MAG: PEP-CTERM sorting domain-containing protein [Candidatus Auribacterota bacterium]|nr:PEP-CTERM sorting domain-containing protein [Candidatus Auribacterota bacterium]